jgi:tRNA(Ile)-lysidine synthase
MTLITRVQKIFLSLLDRHQDKQPTIIIGLSGGPDSVFLLHALAPLHTQASINLHAVHINHGWRESAINDQIFCKSLCEELGISCTIEYGTQWNAKVPQHKQRSGSLEADAREMRRIIFDYYRIAYKADAIALAHHADDQLETFFIRLIRGSGLTGLCSIKPCNGFTVRPLLTLYKEEILEWLTTHKKLFCHDETNTSSLFLRNRIRSSIIPTLQHCDARAKASLLRTINHLQEEEAVLHNICKESILQLQAANGWLQTKQFLAYAPALRTRIMTQLLINNKITTTFSQALFMEIERFLASPRGGTHIITSGWMITKKNKQFRVDTNTLQQASPL